MTIAGAAGRDGPEGKGPGDGDAVGAEGKRRRKVLDLMAALKASVGQAKDRQALAAGASKREATHPKVGRRQRRQRSRAPADRQKPQLCI